MVNGGGLVNGGGDEQDLDAASSTADPPSGLTCANCVVSSGSLVANGKSVTLTWTAPGFGQIRRYNVWRATGSFPTLQSVLANLNAFTNIGKVQGTPPATTFTDSSVKNKTTYTYFVTDANKQGAQSGPSTSVTLTVVF